MKYALLLFLLASFAYLKAEPLQCNTGVILEDRAVNIGGSRVAGANVSLIKAYITSNLHKCLEECCSMKHGSCSIASFNSHTSDYNCFHFSCHPLHKCKYVSSKGIDSYTFPASEFTILNHLDDAVRKLKFQKKTASTPKDNPRSISARKGVNTALSDVVSVVEDGIIDSFRNQLDNKNDNTTIKPRKGVDFFSEIFTHTTDGSAVSGIKPRKGVEMNSDMLNFTKSKVKPRKGVEPYVPHLKTVSPASDYLMTTVADSNVTLDGVNGTDKGEADVITLLQHVFEDDPNVMNSSTNVVKTLNFSTTIKFDFTQSSITPSMSSSSTIMNSPDFLHSSEINSTVVPEVMNKTESSYLLKSSEVTSSQQTISFDIQTETTPILQSSIIDKQQSTVPVVHTTTTTTIPVAASSVASFSEITQLQSSSLLPSRLSTPVTNTGVSFGYEVISSSSLTNGVLFYENVVRADDKEMNRRYKSSMHLVLSLVFGLLVLCVVLGAVAKRIYDVWLRRHYHRMDFLIDGMYDNYS